MLKKDLNQLAKSIVAQATEGDPQPPESVRAKSGRKGGLKGGTTRMASLSKEERTELAKKAATARWGKKAPPASTTDGAKAKSTKQR